METKTKGILFTTTIILSGFLGGAVVGNEVTISDRLNNGHILKGNFKKSKDLETPRILAMEMGEHGFASNLDLVKNGQKRSLVLTLKSTYKTPVANRFVIEVMDDLGVHVMPAFISLDRNLKKESGHRIHSLELDRVLPDGYYEAKANAFFASEHSFSGVNVSEVYFRSVNGEIIRVSEKEWQENSLSDVALKNVNVEKNHE